jgi:RNA polymerase sigma-70 factor (ECF subfamily)
MSPARAANPGTSSSGSSGGSLHLVARLQRQDASAWRRLVEVYTPFVGWTCRRAGLNEADVEDLTQEVFQAAVQHIGGFDRSQPGATLRGWLRVITRNKIRDHFRRARPADQGGGGTTMLQRMYEQPAHEEGRSGSEAAVESAVETGVVTPDERAAETVLFQHALSRIRAEFQERTWLAFWGVVVEGRAARDAGEELGMSPGAVRVAKARVLKRLREELGEGPGR